MVRTRKWGCTSIWIHSCLLLSKLSILLDQGRVDTLHSLHGHNSATCVQESMDISKDTDLIVQPLKYFSPSSQCCQGSARKYQFVVVRWQAVGSPVPALVEQVFRSAYARKTRRAAGKPYCGPPLPVQYTGRVHLVCMEQVKPLIYRATCASERVSVDPLSLQDSAVLCELVGGFEVKEDAVSLSLQLSPDARLTY